MNRIIFEHLGEKGIIKSFENDYGSIELKTSDSEIVIEGNRLELIALADDILSVALSDSDGSHIHLDELFFFTKTDRELIISLKPTSG